MTHNAPDINGAQGDAIVASIDVSRTAYEAAAEQTSRQILNGAIVEITHLNQSTVLSQRVDPAGNLLPVEDQSTVLSQRIDPAGNLLPVVDTQLTSPDVIQEPTTKPEITPAVIDQALNSTSPSGDRDFDDVTLTDLLKAQQKTSQHNDNDDEFDFESPVVNSHQKQQKQEKMVRVILFR